MKLWKVFYTVALSFLWATSSLGLDKSTISSLNNYCSKCHNSKKAKADLDLSSLNSNVSSSDSFEKWILIYEKLKYKEMPPEDAKEIPENLRSQILSELRNEFLMYQQPGKLNDEKLLLPEYGNYIDHEELFRSKPTIVLPASPTVWRLRPELYNSMASSISNRPQGLSQPFTVLPGYEFKDYSASYYIDEPTTELLLKNAELLVENQISFKIDKNNVRKGKFKEFIAITDPNSPPFEEHINAAIKKEFQLILQRLPTKDEISRFSSLWIKIKNHSDTITASKSMLMAIIMQPEALFRLELGHGTPDQYGRQRLSQAEIAKSISFALGNRLDSTLLNAAGKGELDNSESVKKHVTRILNSAKFQPDRLLNFFTEYFGYKRALEVFKDKPERGKYEPKILVSDLECLIEDIVLKDKNVLFNLLTTNSYYVNYKYDNKRKTASRFYTKGVFETVYGLAPDWKWTEKQPVELPKEERAGVLTHPAWLVAWSDNFHNDPIRRGKWIRTKLLGGTVPDIPITVEAKLPEDEKLTLREKLHKATNNPKCRSCHNKMNDLGLPFEQFDHYGLFRKIDLYENVITEGQIKYSDDPELNGSVQNPIELINKLARSRKVEEVFIRHVFRYFLGRNETLGDALTLQKAYTAYKINGGSYKALVTSLLSSDSFLYRMNTKQGKTNE